MQTFSSYLEETNTFRSDINEILLGYYLLGGSWDGFEDSATIKKLVKDRRDKLTDEEYESEKQRSRAMVDTIKDWMQANGFKQKISKVWWTARPGEVARIVGTDVGDNPSDILLQCNDKKYLGISVKSTKGTRQISFKNLGLGTVENELKLKLKDVQTRQESQFIKDYNLSDTPVKRKDEIQSNPMVREKANEARSKTLKLIRDMIYRKLALMPQGKLQQHVVNFWMGIDTSKDQALPMLVPYIIVTGHGSDRSFYATIVDPHKNPKVFAAQTEKLKLTKSGNETIGIYTDTTNIMRIRAKYGTVPMAAPIEFSADPWSTKKDGQSN